MCAIYMQSTAQHLQSHRLIELKKFKRLIYTKFSISNLLIGFLKNGSMTFCMGDSD